MSLKFTRSNKSVLVLLNPDVQWRRQRSKGARSFQCQNILETGYSGALFSSKKLTFFCRRPQNTKAANAAEAIIEAKQSNKQGGARTVDLPARSFDLARPGVAPPLQISSLS